MAQLYPLRAARPLLLVLLLLCGNALFAQQPPTSLKYPTPVVYVAGASNVYLSPTVSGNVSSYSVSPGLPAGLTLNPNTGVISGTPTTASAATTYTVTATNASGSTTAAISLQVTQSYYNNAYAQVSFVGANSTALSGTGQAVGNRVLYSNVATISGTQIDAIITTTSVTNVTSWAAYDQNAASGTGYDSNDPKFFSPQVNFGTGGGSVGFTIQFILGGSYNASTNPNGTAVILQNVYYNSYDIDGNGNTGSNQYNLVGDFNTITLGSPTQIAIGYDAATGLTKFRSTTDQNNATITADPHRIRLGFDNVSSLPIILGAEANGAAYFFLDFSAGPAFSTAQSGAAPTIDLGTAQTGVNNDSAGCASGIPFTRGTTNTNTPAGSLYDSLVVFVPTSQLLNTTNEVIFVNGASPSPTNISLGSSTSYSFNLTIGGVSTGFTAITYTRGSNRYVKFTRTGGTISQAQLEVLIDALQYRNIDPSPTNGSRTFTLNSYNNIGASPDAIFTATVSCVSISGNIWHDANGLSDNTVNANGTPTVTAGFAYAVLTNQSTNLVVASVPISAGGAYTFGTVDQGNYNIYIRNATAAVGSTVTAPTYPSGTSGAYVSTGENFGSGAGTDGLTDGKIVITIGSTTVTNANFGIELPPTTTSSTINSIANPGGYNFYTVPTSGGFNYADEDGTVTSITITSFPTGANYIRLNGILYTNGGTCPPQSTCTAFPAAGVVVPAANISAIAVDPAAAGTTAVVIPFRATDNANINDVNAAPNTLTLNFIAQASPIVVSGNVWDDVNGNGIKDASEVYAAPANNGQTLYALLVQTTNTYSGASTIYASVPVTASATGYTFSNVPSGNAYEVRLTSLATQPADGVALSTITQTLPTGWIDVSYSNSGTVTTGLNVTSPAISLGTVTSTRSNVNFGIDAQPTAVTAATVTLVNPGGTNNAVIPATAFTGTDAVDLAGGAIAYVHITAFPANATSITIIGATTPGGAVTTTTYTSGNFPAGGVYVATAANGNLSNANAVQVDPINGATSIALSYKVVDAAGIESTNTAAANVTFTELTISGTVYNDVNGGVINGTLISSAGGQLYVNLVNTATNTVVSSKAVTGGTYSFTTADGVQNGISTYALVLTNSAAATSSILPSTAWTYTAEGLTGTSGDGGPNGTYAFGANVTANTTIDFGLDALPTTTTLATATSQQNPGGTNNVTIPAGTFTGTDADAANGGIISYIHITALPTNATSITVTGATSIGGAVTTTTYTSANFPAGGLYVATNSAGNPTTSILVDPVDGAVTVDVSYRVVDNAGKESLNTGAARQQLTDFSISGSVYDDPDGGIINGTLRNNAGGQLYVNLVSGTTLVASKPVSAAGTYSFSTADGLQNNVSNYSLVLTNSASATTASISALFAYTAEGLTGTTGDGTPNGTYAFGATVTANTTIDFGIDALPTLNALNTATSQVNPGGTNTITVPTGTFSGSDAGDISGGRISYILLTAFPTNADFITVTGSTTLGGVAATTTYTAGNFPAGGVYIATNASGNPSTSIIVDPAAGAVNVDFSYKVIDNAGKASTATGIARQPLSDLTISGTIYDDATGTTNGLIDGSPISNANGQLYVNLVNTATNTVLASRTLTNGTYSFGTADGLRNDVSTYAVVLAASATSTTGTLPSSTAWVNTAEGLSGTSGDGSPNGRYQFGANVTANKVVDFGIDALPTPAALTTATAQTNPGGTATVTIPATTFNGTDAADLNNSGSISYIHIVSFPANATSVTFAAAATTIGGTPASVTYTSANFPVGGVYVATNTAGNPTSAISVDPINGAVNVDFTYRVVDNANQESTTSGIARQPLTDLTISGLVYDDVNGGTIDGNLISSAGGQLYVNLINTTTGTVVSSKAVTAGAYSFGTSDGVNNTTTYRLVLTNSASATGATLPSTGWVYMAEGTSGSTGDGTPNGVYNFGSAITGNTAIDFAIEALPVPAALTTATPQANPGGTATVTVPATTFVASDASDLNNSGAVSYIHITAFPTNATTVNFANAATSVNGTYGALSYNAGNFPAGGVYVATTANGNPTSAITVDPVNGAVNVDFTFTAIDNSGKESLASGIARQPLTDVTISGTVFDDANGTKDNTINGTGTGTLGGTQLYVSLVSGGTVVATQAVAGNGTYSFSTTNGVQNGTTYSVVLSTTAAVVGQPAPAAALPSGWVNTAEGTTASGDGTPNGVASTGSLSGNTSVNFGVNALPIATSTTITAQANPSGNTLVTIPSASFPGSDPDTNGAISYVHLTSFPTNVTSVYAYSSTSVNGPFAYTTYTSFPAGGIYLPTSSQGFLLPVDALQIDPVDNALTAVFNYTIIDTAGYQSNTAQTTVPFLLGAISGTVYNDANGLTDALIDGVGTNLAGQLYVNAVSGGTVVASAPVASNGTYVLSGLTTGTYTLTLTTSNSSSSPALPTNYVFTAEGVAATQPTGDGSPNGQLVVTIGSDGLANANFGFDGQPVANSITATPKVNPGGSLFIPIANNLPLGSDPYDVSGNQVTLLHVLSLPTNVNTIQVKASETPGGAITLQTYTSATFPAGGIYVATTASGATLDSFYVDPVDGADTIVIQFRAIDVAGVESGNIGIGKIPFSDLTISGTVYDDVNGGVIDGTPISNAGGQLYVNLVNTATGTVVASKQLSNGTYSFGTADGVLNTVSTYQVILTKDAALTTPTLPSSAWVFLAEGLTGTTGDGTVNGRYVFGAVVTTATVVDFAIDARPTATPLTATTQVNPGGTNSVTVPASTFSGADNGDLAGGLVQYVHILTFPTNATSITITGSTTAGGAVTTQTYTSGNFPSNGVYIAADNNGNLSNATAVQVDPIDGAVTVAISYRTVDNAGVESTPATARQPFSDLLITGTVYDDANGTTNSLIDGTPISNAGGQLYVNLVDAQTGTVVASKLLTNGTYSFGTADGVDVSVTTYQLVLANSPTALAPALPAPAAWVNTAEGISGTAGDGFPNGRYQVGAISASRVVDFGIDALPVPATLTVAATQTNPGGTNTAIVPSATFSATDVADLSGGAVNFIHITSFPTNTTTVSFASAATSVNGTYGALSYTSATFPAGGVYLATGGTSSPQSQITVDPVDGAVNVDFTYTAIDNAGKESTTSGTARQPFVDLLLSGNVYDDVDGGLINGVRISTAGGQLYVNLVDTAANTVIASKQLTDGTFSFGTANGLSNTVTTYKLVLTTSATATAPALPSALWVNTAEGISGTTGDGLANGGYALGGAVTANTTVDFGVDARPVAVPITIATPKVNPGGNLFIGIANNLPLASDPLDVSGGQVARLHVLTLPTNVNAIQVTSSETINGALAFTTYTTANFPAGGIYVATNASGSTLDSFYIDPVNGADTVLITFRAIDQAGVESLTSGFGKIPIVELTITGNVHNDVTGNNGGIVNGTLISSADGQLYVNLVNSATNTVVSSKAVTNGQFSFSTADGLRNDVSTYYVVLASTPTATTATLPDAINWVYTGEGPNATPDGLPNGRYTFNLAITDPVVLDFGVDARPLVTGLITATAQLNPGGTGTVVVPASTFAGTDADAANGGVISYIHITTFPTNATSIVFANAATTLGGTAGPLSYTASSFPAGGVYVATNSTGNPSSDISVDPIDGAVNVDITYSTIDNASVESVSTGIARQPFTALLVSGNVFDDYNGLTDALLNGTGTNASGSLYVNALDGNGTVLASATVAANGTWSIGGLSAGNYTLVLTTSPAGSTAAVPAGWVLTGEGTGTTSDGTVNGSTALTLTTSDVSNINFTIERYAIADAKHYNFNPDVSPVVTFVTIPSTAIAADSFAARINLSGALSSGSTPGALTGLDPDGGNISALTLTTGTPNVTLLIDPSTYRGLRNGQTLVDAVMVEYAGIQLQPGGCQGTDQGNSVCSLYNSATGYWEIPSYNLSQLKVLVRNGASSVSFDYSWRDVAGEAGTFATYTISFDQNLPVHLITFTGEKRGTNAVLNWKSVNEVNFRGYGVERSLDGRNFTQIGFVNGRNLTTLQSYGYTDDLSVLPAGRVYYRLKQLDLNGSFEYSPVVTLVNGAGSIEPGVTLLVNPVKSQIRLQVRTTAATQAGFTLVDGGGRVVYRSQQNLVGGTTAITLDVPSFLSSGTYYLLTQFDGKQFSNKVSVNR